MIAPAPAHAAATQRYVAKNGNDRLADKPSNDCSDKTAPCLTIQHAIDESGSGDTIHIGTGTYDESLNVEKSLTFLGAGSTGSSRTVVDGQGDAGSSFYLSGFATEGAGIDVTIKGIAVDGNRFNTGVYARFAVALDLVDSSVSKNDVNGLFAYNDVTVSLTNTTIAENKMSGVLLGPATTTLTASASSITDNGLNGVVLEHDRGLATQANKADKHALVDSPSVTIENGSSVSGNKNHGVYVDLPDTTVTVTNSTVSGNSHVGIDFYAPLFDPTAGQAARLTITGSTIADNGDRGVYTNVPAAISRSTVNGNANNGLETYHLATVDRSTFDGNTRSGIDLEQGSATVTSSTITGTKPSPDAGHASGGIGLQLIGNAVAANTPKAKSAADVAPSVTVTGSIVASQYKKTVPDCAGTITDGGWNLSSDTANSCGFSTAKHDLVKTDPLLGALADNGGPTKTKAPLKHSPAIDYIPSGSAGCTSGATDQRGIARPQPSGGRCDVGAVELAAKALAIHPDSLRHGTVGKAYAQTITASGGQFPSYTFVLESGSLPPGLSFDAHGHITGTPTKAGSFTFTVSVNDPVSKTYTIVIDKAAISDTGAHVGGLTVVGAGGVLAGFVLLLGAGRIGRRPRHRRS